MDANVLGEKKINTYIFQDFKINSKDIDYYERNDKRNQNSITEAAKLSFVEMNFHGVRE